MSALLEEQRVGLGAEGARVGRRRVAHEAAGEGEHGGVVRAQRDAVAACHAALLEKAADIGMRGDGAYSLHVILLEACRAAPAGYSPVTHRVHHLDAPKPKIERLRPCVASGVADTWRCGFLLVCSTPSWPARCTSLLPTAGRHRPSGPS